MLGVEWTPRGHAIWSLSVGAQGAESPPDLAPCATIKNDGRQEKGTTGSTLLASGLRWVWRRGVPSKPFGPDFGWGPASGKALRATEDGWGPVPGEALRATEDGWGPVPGEALRATEDGWGPVSGMALRAPEVGWGPASRKALRAWNSAGVMLRDSHFGAAKVGWGRVRAPAGLGAQPQSCATGTTSEWDCFGY